MVVPSGPALVTGLASVRTITVTVVGRHPDAVAEDVEASLNAAAADGWRLRLIQPITYNSSTTGYLLLLLERGDGAAP